MSNTKIIAFVADQLNFSPKQISTVAGFLDEGATIPFLARYRQEATGGLDEEQLRLVRDSLELQKTLEARKETILKSIKEQEKLTPELEAQILACTDLKTLEDLYLPYKQKRKTRGDKAKEKGLEPLAKMIWEQELEAGNPEELAKEFINPEKEVETIEDAF